MALKMKLLAMLGAFLMVASGAGWAQNAERDKPREGQSSVGGLVDDAVLNAKVRTALVRDRSLESADVWVKADDGVVTIGGSVSRSDDRRKAETVARAVEGVRSVKNEIKVK